MPAGTGVWVVKTVRARAAASASSSDAPAASSARASSSEAKAAWPSLRWTTDGSIPSARSARMPPTPSSRYWARRRSRVPVYSRELIQRATAPFSGRSRVEQEERHAPDVDAPDLRDDLLGADGDGDGDRLAVVAGDERHGLALGIGRHPRLVLPAGGVDALAEVALAVEQADGDERQRAVGGLLEDVAGQRAEPAGVDRQRGVDAVLGAEEAHRALGASPGRGVAGGAPGRRGCSPPARRPRCDQPVVGRGALQRVGRRLAQQAHRVLAAQLPALRVDGAEGVGAAGRPRPAQVVRRPRQRVQRRGHARGKGLRGVVDVLAAGQHGRA